MTPRLKKQIVFGLGLAVIAFVFVPEHFAQASVFTDPVGTVIQSILTWWFSQIGAIIAILAKSLNYAIDLRAGGSIPVVAATWKILRDFANMFFIIMLIYVAFATIFDQKNYAFQSMIVRFIVVAVLINFSLTLGNLVIDACQVLTNVFLGSIGNLGDRLGTYLNPAALLPAGVGAGSLVGGGLVSLIFGIILAMIFLFSLLVALTFAFIRIPFIWGLLIVSPIAWMSLILPSSQKWFSMWWAQFRGWNLFLPVYLFFMYLGLIFLSQRDTVIHAVLHFNTTNGVDPSTTPIVAGLTNGMTFNLFFFYIFTAVIMIGGTWAALKTTSMMGSGFEKGVGWARGLIKNVPIIPGAGGVTSLESLQKAAAARQAQFKQGGFENPYLNKLYGGEEGRKRMDARTQAGFPFKVDGALQKSIDMEKKLLEERGYSNNIEKLRGLADSGPREQRIAAGMRLTELGVRDPKQIMETYALLGKEDSEPAQKFIEGLKYDKMDEAARKYLFDNVKNIEARKKIAETRLEKDKFKKAEDLRSMMNALKAPDAEGNQLADSALKDILGKGEKKNAYFSAVLKTEMNLDTDTDPNKILEKSLSKMNEDDLLSAVNDLDFDVTDPTDEKYKERDAFEGALGKAFQKNSKRLIAVAGKATNPKAIDMLNTHAKKAFKNEKKQDREKEIANILVQQKKKRKLEENIAALDAEMDNVPSPSSMDRKDLQAKRDKLQKSADAVNDKMDKIKEKIKNIISGTPGAPTP